MEEEIKTPPHSAEAERSVLGSILLDADAGDNLRVLDLCLTHGLEPDSFYDPRNRILFETLLEMSQATMPVDAITLNEQLRATGRLEAVGGVTAVESLVNATPTSAHAEYYIDIVRQKHVLRKLINTARETERKCYGGDGRNADVILGEAETAFLGIGGETTVRTVKSTVSWTTLPSRVQRCKRRSAPVRSGIQNNSAAIHSQKLLSMALSVRKSVNSVSPWAKNEWKNVVIWVKSSK